MALDTESASKALFGKHLTKEKSSEPNPEVKENELNLLPKEEPAHTVPLTQQPKASQKVEEPSAVTEQIPKWQSLDKVTVLLTAEQKEGLDRVAKKVMKFRSRDLKGNDSKERITANTLIRALVENFLRLEDSMQMEVLSSEEDVHEWVKALLSRKSGS